MSVENNVPEIRLKGFSGDWIYKKLEDLTETGFSNGVFNDPQKVGKGYRLINVKDMYSGDSINIDNLSLVDIDENEFKNNKVEYGDIFFTRSSLVREGIAYSNVNLSNRDDITFDGHLIRMQPCMISNDPVFLAYLFKTSCARKQLVLGGKTTTMTTIGQSDIAVVELALANKLEQTQIGNYFQKLDNLIKQHQQKHDKLSNVKKAMLEKMFPKKGEAIPEIRFKGFSGDWEEVTLGEYARFTKGQGYSKSDLSESGTPIILYGRLYTNYQTVISQVDTFAIEKSKSLKSVGNEVIVPASGESSEDIARASAVCESGVILGGDLNIIYPNDKINPVFLALVISNGYPQKELASKAQGKSVVHIRNSDLDALLFTMPKKKEQTVIGNYFQKLDTLINQHQQQITKLNNIKQAYLSKMFV
ncbi:restriction endonuclease subunit S [Vibrio kanaloae]|uniref:restriction endonuclease subunit S n=1 Tax=Vibrio kanaloae TaxID=170673 RepID=UPI0035A6C674